MANLIKVLLGQNTKPIEALRKIVALNEADQHEMKAYGLHHDNAIGELNSLMEDFRAEPSPKKADVIAAKSAAVRAEEMIRTELALAARPAIREKIAVRTRPALQAALNTIRERLQTELAASRERDAQFEGENANRLGEVVVMGQQPARASTMTTILENKISTCDSYLARLAGMDAEKLRGPIAFCLDE